MTALEISDKYEGVIKGSEGTIQTKNGRLDRETYVSLSSKSQPTFSDQRNLLYDLFERYLSLKKSFQEYDNADRCS